MITENELAHAREIAAILQPLQRDWFTVFHAMSRSSTGYVPPPYHDAGLVALGLFRFRGRAPHAKRVIMTDLGRALAAVLAAEK